VYEGMIIIAGGYHDICTNKSDTPAIRAVEVYDPDTDR
jgi:hypothetical protein